MCVYTSERVRLVDKWVMHDSMKTNLSAYLARQKMHQCTQQSACSVLQVNCPLESVEMGSGSPKSKIGLCCLEQRQTVFTLSPAAWQYLFLIDY